MDLQLTESRKMVSAFDLESAWLSKITRCRLDAFDNRKINDNIFERRDAFPLPDFSGIETNYTEFIRTYRFSFEERLLLSLAFIPYIKPHFLSAQFSRQDMS